MIQGIPLPSPTPQSESITTSLTESSVSTVDSDWTKPIAGGKASDKKGTYEVTHRRSGSRFSQIIEKKDPIDYDMVARVKPLGHLR